MPTDTPENPHLISALQTDVTRPPAYLLCLAFISSHFSISASITGRGKANILFLIFLKKTFSENACFSSRESKLLKCSVSVEPCGWCLFVSTDWQTVANSTEQIYMTNYQCDWIKSGSCSWRARGRSSCRGFWPGSSETTGCGALAKPRDLLPIFICLQATWCFCHSD